MADTFIQMDRSKDMTRDAARAMQMFVEAANTLERVVAAMTHARDGDGSSASHYALLVTLGCYPTNEDAKESFDELASLNGNVGQHAAIKSCAAKHGV